MSMAKNPAAVAEKWQRRLSAATPDIEAGVNAVRENPAQKAVAKQQKLVQNFNAAVTSGKWAAGLNRVTLDDWKRAMLQKGLNRVAQGATAAQPKVQAFMAQLLPYQESLSAEIQSMPDLTLEDSINRMTRYIRGMADFKRS